MITFEQARAITLEAMEDYWPLEAGVVTASNGLESDTTFVVFIGPYARIVSPRNDTEDELRWSEASLDEASFCVDKSTGEFFYDYELDLDGFLPCGNLTEI